MPVRDNVRERRRERIRQLIGQRAIEETTMAEIIVEGAAKPKKVIEEVFSPDHIRAGPPRIDAYPVQPPATPRAEISRSGANDSTSGTEDPELWWKEREKQLKSGQTGWQGVKGIPSTSTNRVENPTRNFDMTKLIQGFMARLVISGLLFAAVWGWLKLGLPGSVETRSWMVTSVTRDMDFQAIEAWYGQTFGGTPTFFPFNRNQTDTKEVSAILKPEQTAIPVQGRLIQSFTENGTGVKVAATGGSEVRAIFTGRVLQVTKDHKGGFTILVQHQNHILSVYGNLEKASVKPNDWVETGQLLGQLPSSGSGAKQAVLYFAVQQNGKTLDPASVVSFD
jgi:stage IV sporulation protein FA